MAFMAKRRIYESLPLSVKRVACLVPFAWLAGHAYRRTVRRAAFFERASACEIHAYQEQQLGKVLCFAADRVPAYRALRGAVDRLTPFEALKAFPLLDKDTLQANVHRYLPRDFDRMPHYEVTTGGTSSGCSWTMSPNRWKPRSSIAIGVGSVTRRGDARQPFAACRSVT